MNPRGANLRVSELPLDHVEHEDRLRFTWLDKSMLQHAHPPKLILDTIAYMWGLFFFWHQELIAGVVVLFAVGGLGTLLAFRKDFAALARTPLGKFFLVSSHPVNMLLQVAGYIAIAYGCWIHSTPTVLGGVTCVLAGHLFGWRRFETLT